MVVVSLPHRAEDAIRQNADLSGRLSLIRACLKIKNCTKHVFLSPFHDRIKKKGAFICQDVMN